MGWGINRVCGRCGNFDWLWHAISRVCRV